MAAALRICAAEIVEHAGAGHCGAPLGLADLATVLVDRHLRFNARHPSAPHRDRLILSNGHAGALLYAMAHLLDVPGYDKTALKSFREIGSRLPGHPERSPEHWVELTTGPLGQGLGAGVGMALAETLASVRDGRPPSTVYIIAGDGCMMEGLSHEASCLAAHWRLPNLVVLYDDNQVTCDGPLTLSASDDVSARFQAYGWTARTVDGHDITDVDLALADARSQSLPTLLRVRTTIAKGAPGAEGDPQFHDGTLGRQCIALMRENEGWASEAFAFPAAVRAAWRCAGRRWPELRPTPVFLSNTLATRPDAASLGGSVWTDIQRDIEAAHELGKPLPGRSVSRFVLERLIPDLPDLLVGSADLADSTFLQTRGASAISADDRSGRFINFGVREHGMAAALTGIAAHGRFRIAGSTYLAFADYMKPAIRMAAMMELPAIFVFTHDSILIGQDGPTHQPIEQLTALRAVPGLRVLRPGSFFEAVAAWRLAVEATQPVALILPRQPFPMRFGNDGIDWSGAPRCVHSANRDQKLTIVASGSEVATALELLKARPVFAESCALISCMDAEALGELSDDTFEALFGSNEIPVLTFEAAASDTWARLLTGRRLSAHGLTRFGTSGRPHDVADHVSMTPAALAETVEALLRAPAQ